MLFFKRLNPMAHQWRPLDILKLKELFLKGHSLKEMAKELSRSVTAVNKAISRFGLREKMPLLPRPIPTALWPKEHHHSLPQRLKRKQFIPYENRKSVELDQVIDFLRKKNHVIYIRENQWYLDHICVNIQQMILKANQIRVSEHLPVFFITYLK
jgi:hypothetical protein